MADNLDCLGDTRVSSQVMMGVKDIQSDVLIVGDIEQSLVAVTSHNTPVTLLTNFQLVPGHTVTSIHILRFPELMFRARTWMQSMATTHLDIIIMSHHFQILQIMEVLHPRPYLCL